MSDSNDFAIRAPASLLQELWNLCRLSRSSLADDDGYRECLKDIKQALSVLRNGQESGRFVKSWDERRVDAQFRHDQRRQVGEQIGYSGAHHRSLSPRNPPRWKTLDSSDSLEKLSRPYSMIWKLNIHSSCSNAGDELNRMSLSAASCYPGASLTRHSRQSCATIVAQSCLILPTAGLLRYPGSSSGATSLESRPPAHSTGTDHLPSLNPSPWQLSDLDTTSNTSQRHKSWSIFIHEKRWLIPSNT